MNISYCFNTREYPRHNELSKSSRFLSPGPADPEWSSEFRGRNRFMSRVKCAPKCLCRADRAKRLSQWRHLQICHAEQWLRNIQQAFTVVPVHMICSNVLDNFAPIAEHYCFLPCTWWILAQESSGLHFVLFGSLLLTVLYFFMKYLIWILLFVFAFGAVLEPQWWRGRVCFCCCWNLYQANRSATAVLLEPAFASCMPRLRDKKAASRKLFIVQKPLQKLMHPWPLLWKTNKLVIIWIYCN